MSRAARTLWFTLAVALVIGAIGVENGASAQATKAKGKGKNTGGFSGVPEDQLWVKPPVEAIRTERKLLASKTLGRDVSYVIYLPPSYETGDARYPVLYWLHGRGGAQTGIPQMVRRWDDAIGAGKAPPMIVVFVNGLAMSSFEDSADGKLPVETISIKELIPHIDATYRTIAAREARMIEGFSMGGSGAAEWGFKYPELFGAVSILAGALFDGSSGPRGRGKAGGGESSASPSDGVSLTRNDPFKLVETNAEKIRGRTLVRIVVGAEDGLEARNRAYHELLDRLKIPHEFHVIEGAAHSHAPLYDALGDKNGEFYQAAVSPAAGDARRGASAEQAPRQGAARSNARPEAQRTRTAAAWLRNDESDIEGVKQAVFDSATLGQKVSYLVYLPPDYDNGAERFPVIYWLHGLNGTPASGARAFVPQLDAAIRAGKMPPAIAVMVNGMVSSFYCDAPDGKLPVESVIVDDLVPHIDAAYRTRADRGSRIIEGYSMGGYGAAHLGFKYPELFGAVAVDAGALLMLESMSGRHADLFAAVYGASDERFEAEHPFTLARKNADRLRGQTMIRIGCGTADGLLPLSEALRELLDELSIEHEFVTAAEVGHAAPTYYRVLGPDAFDFHRRAFATRER